jgi:hypothetical protein
MTDEPSAMAKETAPAIAEPKKPIFDRLVLSVIPRDVHGTVQPQIGATIEVDCHDGTSKSIWLQAKCWDGIAALITQIAQENQDGVAEFLEALQFHIDPKHPLYLLLNEVINEMRSNPYGDLVNTPLDTHDWAW